MPSQQPSGVKVFHAQRVGLNELAPGFHDIAHQLGEDVVSLGQIVDLHLQQRPRLGSSVVSHSCSGFISPKPL